MTTNEGHCPDGKQFFLKPALLHSRVSSLTRSAGSGNDYFLNCVMDGNMWLFKVGDGNENQMWKTVKYTKMIPLWVDDERSWTTSKTLLSKHISEDFCTVLEACLYSFFNILIHISHLCFLTRRKQNWILDMKDSSVGSKLDRRRCFNVLELHSLHYANKRQRLHLRRAHFLKPKRSHTFTVSNLYLWNRGRPLTAEQVRATWVITAITDG